MWWAIGWYYHGNTNKKQQSITKCLHLTHLNKPCKSEITKNYRSHFLHNIFSSEEEMLSESCDLLWSQVTKYQDFFPQPQYKRVISPSLRYALGHVCAISDVALLCKHIQCTSLLFFMFLSKVLLCGWCQEKLKKLRYYINTYLIVPLTAWFHHGAVNCLVWRWTFVLFVQHFWSRVWCRQDFLGTEIHSVLISVVRNGNLMLSYKCLKRLLQ